MLHNDKIRFYNVLADLSRRHSEIADQLRGIYYKLPRECKDITEDIVIQLLAAIPSRDTSLQEAALKEFVEEFV